MYVAQLTLVALLASRLPLLSVVCKKKTFAIFFPNSSENWKKSKNLIGKAEHLP